MFFKVKKQGAIIMGRVSLFLLQAKGLGMKVFFTAHAALGLIVGPFQGIAHS